MGGFDVPIFGTDDDERMRRMFGAAPVSRPPTVPGGQGPMPPEPTTAAPVTDKLGAPPSTPVEKPMGLKPPYEPGSAADLRAQGEPRLGGWKKGLEIASNALVPGLTAQIPGTPENYRQRLGRAEGEETRQLGMRNIESEIGLRSAEAEKARRETPPKPDKPESLQQELADATADAISRGVDPNKDPKVQQISDVVTGLQKQQAPPKDNKAVSGTVNGQPAWGLQTETGWIDPDTKRPIPGFKPPLNYAQGVAPTKTVELLGPDNVMHRFQYNEATGAYDKDMGAAPTGTSAHQIFQAGAIEKLAPQIIADINDNRAILGKLSSYYKQWTAGTPVSDPKAAALMTELMSFAAMQPALHAFRSTNALEAFEKLIGGLAKDPDATIATIQALLKTPQAFTSLPNSSPTPAAPNRRVIDLTKP